MLLYVITPGDPDDVSVIEEYQKVEWTRRLYVPSGMVLDIDAVQLGTTPLEKGRFVYVPEGGRAYMIEQIHRTYATNDRGEETESITALGREVGGMFEERIIVPPGGSSHDVQTAVTAEAALKHYVSNHAGPTATAARQVPGLTMAPNLGRGPTVTYEARFQSVAEVLSDLGVTSEIGWEVTFDLATGGFVFDVIEGTDRTGEVFLDPEFETAAGMEWLTSDLGRKNWGLIAGQGEGASRDADTTWVGASEPAGFDRRETFIDANDLPAGSALDARGQAKLLETLTEDAYEVTVHPGGAFQYGDDFDLGDVVSVRHREWGILAAARIVGVTQAVASAGSGRLATTIGVGRLFPTLPGRARGTSNGSSRR